MASKHASCMRVFTSEVKPIIAVLLLPQHSFGIVVLLGVSTLLNYCLPDKNGYNLCVLEFSSFFNSLVDH